MPASEETETRAKGRGSVGGEASNTIIDELQGKGKWEVHGRDVKAVKDARLGQGHTRGTGDVAA